MQYGNVYDYLPDSTLNIACTILDDSVGICASSSRVVSGGFFPKFFPPTVHPPSPILPSTSALPHQPPSSTLATPSVAIRSQQTSTNHQAKLMSFSLRQERVQQNAHQATTLAITVEDCNLSSEECEAQRVNALTKDDLAILYYGEQPGGLYFDQTRMRKHLMYRLEAQYLSTFPIVRKRRRAAKVKLSSTIRLYCSCRMPELAGRTMIQCCACKEWFHVDICVTVPNEALDSATKWFCNNCT